MRYREFRPRPSELGSEHEFCKLPLGDHTEQANQSLLKHRISLFECNGLGNQIEVGSMQCRWFFTSRGGGCAGTWHIGCDL